ncbi:L,D-transpeptidase [Roseivirga sp.]|uniref:L,D-transpeptidase n=1 Tax=Roseivirga sp. TaxID=1964215 RepID=UPI000D7A4152|nr:L,D-transpeptidase [Roseivirga sp.]MBO6659392.1 L,D-transpeptidase [Roseivirga sp.]MBO6907871.1 L,D-transpeptidase [Roseivirga sp.]PWL28433.1 MAG: L,D-transpeptidase [Roseivirga sp. XM-24bin3]
MNKRIVKTLMIVSLSISGLLLVLNLQSVTIALATIGNEPKVNDSTFQVMKANAEKELTSLDKKLKANMPKTNYLVVNSTMNEFYLYKGDELIKKDMCSTGSYVLLKKSEKEKWMFKTPKGEFRILNKTKDPVWKKPDWAFVEEGLPVPSYNHPSRFEYGVLGDYSLSLGDGYLIHGTLFQRFLGLPVTHGCIRLNDENLELVYKSMPMGAKVYIF